MATSDPSCSCSDRWKQIADRARTMRVRRLRPADRRAGAPFLPRLRLISVARP